MSTIVERKIRFYRMRVLPDDDGNVKAFSIGHACAAINRLGFLIPASPTSRYMQGMGDEDLGVWIRTTGNKNRLCLGTCRGGGLPQLDELGTISPLTIKARQRLLEQTHVMFFPGHIVGAEFNFYGPRVSRLPAYFHEKIPDYPRVQFDPLLNQDAQELLSHLSKPRLLRFRVHRGSTDILKAAHRHLPGALDAASQRFGAEVVEVIFRADSRSRKSSMARAVLDFLGEIVGVPSAVESVDVLQARGLDDRTGQIEAFDFLSDKLVFSCRVIKSENRLRAVDSADMFSQIEKAYNDHREQLEEAARIEA